ncbi:MAG TPA: GNAT family N-acetyltransferase [Pseudoxanthomonas sp.]|nr:GNAT family N-acetyltransferase [Pseudoxanthomonas sp.]
MTVSIHRAGIDDLDAIAPLFDLYRQFYGKAADAAIARDFVGERLRRGESVVLLARIDGETVGFTQLFPSFSSVSAGRVWVLNDLYVVAEARRHGVAKALLQAAADFARGEGALRLELETNHDNASAQALYRHLGWEAHDDTLRFRLPLTA